MYFVAVVEDNVKCPSWPIHLTGGPGPTIWDGFKCPSGLPGVEDDVKCPSWPIHLTGGPGPTIWDGFKCPREPSDDGIDRRARLPASNSLLCCVTCVGYLYSFGGR